MQNQYEKIATRNLSNITKILKYILQRMFEPDILVIFDPFNYEYN